MVSFSQRLTRFNPVYQRYRFIALAIYLAVLVAGVIDWAYGGIGGGSLIRAAEQVRGAVFMGAMVLLIGLELAGFGKASFEPSSKPNLLAFAFRALPFATIFLVSDLKYIRILFLILVLYSYLGVHRWVSYALALLGITILLSLSIANPVVMGILPAPRPNVQQGQVPPRPETPPLNVGQLLDRSMGSIIALFFTLLLARALAQTLQDKQKLEELNGSLEASHLQLQHYANRVADLATTEERNRLARDIHDSLGHHLAAINIQLEKASAYKERDPKRSREALGHAQRSVQDALKDVRQSVASLRDDGGAFSFDDALITLIQRMRHSELDISLNKIGDHSGYSKLTLMTLYRVIQEGLTNVHKHAGASKVNITLDFSGQNALLELNDNGRGFAREGQDSEQATFGLKGLQERLSLVGGQLRIASQVHQEQNSSSQEQGTKLQATIPKKILPSSANYG
ncbi:MAG: sensor histidine kinase [Trueperaceae bacterium]